jgi:hypothetical protein
LACQHKIIATSGRITSPGSPWVTSRARHVRVQHPVTDPVAPRRLRQPWSPSIHHQSIPKRLRYSCQRPRSRFPHLDRFLDRTRRGPPPESPNRIFALNDTRLCRPRLVLGLFQEHQVGSALSHHQCRPRAAFSQALSCLLRSPGSLFGQMLVPTNQTASQASNLPGRPTPQST